MIEAIILLLIYLSYIYLTFLIGQGKKKLLFYIMIYLPYIPITMGLIIFPDILIDLIVTLNSFFIIALFVAVAERAVWGMTLSYASGEDQLIWFYLVYTIPFVGWFLYWITKIR
jgi:hypothetical protein